MEVKKTIKVMKAEVSGEQPSAADKKLSDLDNKIVNYDFDRHSEAARAIPGMIGVIHVTRFYSAHIPESAWKAKCGWRFGIKDKDTWALLDREADLTRYDCCSRCLGGED